MAQAFFPTASNLITRALTDIGAIDPEGGITPTAAQLTDGLAVLNYLVTSWQAHGMQVWCQKQGTYVLTAASSYTVGSGGNINIQRPLAITRAWLRDTVADPDIDIQLVPISREDYDLIPTKEATGTPVQYFYDPQYDLPGSNSGATAKGKIFIWPVPTAAVITQYDLYFTYTRPIQDFSATSDSLDFPQEWGNALRWNLALELCPSYEVPVTKYDRIVKRADDTLQLALAGDRETSSMFVAPADA